MQTRRPGQLGLSKAAVAQRGQKRHNQAAQAAPAAATERDSQGRTTTRSKRPATEATESNSPSLPARTSSRRLNAASTAPAPAPTPLAAEPGAAPTARSLRKRQSEPEPEPEPVEPVLEAALEAGLESSAKPVAKRAAKPGAEAAIVVHSHRGRSDEGVLKTFDGDDITQDTDHELQSLKLDAVKNSDKPKPQRGACGIFWCRAGGATWGCATCAVRICSFECWHHHTKAMAPLYHHNSIKPEFEPLKI